MSYAPPSPAALTAHRAAANRAAANLAAAAHPYSSSTRSTRAVPERHFDARRPVRRVSVHPAWSPDMDVAAAARVVERIDLKRPAATYLPAGAFGVPAVYVVTPALHAALRALRAGLEHGVGDELPPVGARVVVKYTRLDPGTASASPDGQRTVDVSGTVREAQAQHLLSHKCVVLGGKRRCAADVVPRLWFAGVLADPGIGVAVMDMVDGSSLRALVPGKVSAAVYAHVEKAVMTMWYTGVAHADLHADNVLVDSRTNIRVRVLDFGYSLPFKAALLPPARTAAQLARAIATRRKWMPAVQANIVGVARTRRFEWANPDTKLLDVVREAVADPENLNAARAEAWGVPFGAAPARESAYRAATRRLRAALAPW